MKSIQTDTKVTIAYRMTTHLPDGTAKEHPEERACFIYGVDRQVPALEKALEGRQPGEKVSLVIPSQEIYGDHDPELIREIPKKGLIRQRIREGKFYRQMKNGTLISFKILEIRPDTLLVDFNRPMAGISVSMQAEVLAVEDASKKDIDAAMQAQIRRSIGCQ